MESDKAVVHFAHDKDAALLTPVLSKQKDFIEQSTNTPIKEGIPPENVTVIAESTTAIKDEELKVTLYLLFIRC